MTNFLKACYRMLELNLMKPIIFNCKKAASRTDSKRDENTRSQSNAENKNRPRISKSRRSTNVSVCSDFPSSKKNLKFMRKLSPH